MLISDFAIRRPMVTVVTVLALVIFGLFALLRLQTDEYPDVQQPIVNVSIPYPGASPDVVEREVLDRVEEAVSGISGVDQMSGSAQDGFANVLVTFLFEKDIQQATQDIRDKISAIRDQLPPEMKEPILTRFDPSDYPIVQVALNSTTLSAPELTRLADPDMTRELRGIEGVANVTVAGGVERELTVYIRPEAMQAAGVSVAEVVAALQAQNIAVPVGKLNGALDQRSIRLRGKLQAPEDFLALTVAERGGTPIRLGQVATVLDGTAEPTSIALYSGNESVGLLVNKAKGYSTTQVAGQVLARIHEMEKTLPPGTTMQVVQNSGDRVSRSVTDVDRTLFVGAFLTVLVVFLFLNSWRSTVITGLALPVSVLSAFIAVYAFGFTLNTMSLMGLSLAIGILIDDAIVVRENIVRHIERGKDHYTASREATDEIGLAVAATSFSIIAVFVPVAFMYGIAGQWFKPFALTIACAVLVSLFVSFSLDPMLSAYWADPQLEAGQHRNWLSRKLEGFNRWFNRLTRRYTLVVAWALDHRWWMVLLAVTAFFGAIFLQVTFGGFGFVPDSDRSEFVIQVETPPGSNLDYTRLKTEEAARMARAHREIAYTFSTIGSGGLAVPGGALGSPELGTIYVKMIRKSDRSISQKDFGEVMRHEVAQIGGATVSVFVAGFGAAALKQIQVQLRGRDANVLNVLADSVMQVVKSVPGAVDVGLSTKGQKPELEIQLNRPLAGALGVTVGQVAQALRPAFAGVDAGDWVDPSGENRKVRVRLTPESRTRVVDIQRLPLLVPKPGGGSVAMPLGQIATISEGRAPAVITHLDRDNVVAIQANITGRSLGEVNGDIQKKLASFPLPAGYRFSAGGEVQDQQRFFSSLFAALGLAVMLMYLILVVQFGSFLDPLAIMMSLPLSLIGVVLALLVTGGNFNIMAMIGVILLMGIVAKNAILLIDFAKWAREKEGLPLRDALIEAGSIRLRPILMTTLALIAGMLPVAIGAGEGGDFRAPLGRAVIGGVITSTILTLLVIPTFYEIFDSWRQRFSRGVGVRVRQKTATHPVPGRALPESGD